MKTKFKICEVFTRKFDNKVRLVISRTNIYMGLMNMLQFYVAWLGLKKKSNNLRFKESNTKYLSFVPLCRLAKSRIGDRNGTYLAIMLPLDRIQAINR